MTPSDDRTDELRRRLADLNERIARACEAAGRDAAEVTLIVVTKTWPASDVAILADLGVRDIGENRDQEASAKAQECSGLGLTWHFIGQLQRKKAGHVCRYADYVHSVDRPELATALQNGAERAERRIGAFVQVDVSANPQPGRGGAAPADVPGLCAQVAATGNLDLVGLMAVAPLDEDPRVAFARLAELHHEILPAFPQASWLSAGMSGDLEAAIGAGATHVRVGSAVLGVRQNVR